VRAALAGHQVSGLIGPSDQVHVLRAALGLAEVPARHAKDEPGFTLDLADLRLADPQGCRLCPVTAADREVLLPWRAQYEAELFAAPPAEARAAAETQIGRWITADSHRLLWQGDVPVALTGFNARLPQVVQVGGVFVPPGLRGQGHARRAVGMHLAQARAAGVDRAVLFAASEPAERSYRALGFRRGDDMGLVLLARPQEIAA
jgi:GNAT superfamily N-acetyltransferase